jgi:hypothetical protein
VVLRRLIAPRSPTVVAPVIAVSLLSIGCIAPTLLGFMLKTQVLPVGLALTSPIDMLQRYRVESDLMIYYMFLVAWSLLILVIAGPWFIGQWDAFRRHVPKQIVPSPPPPPPTAELVTPAPTA